MKGFGYFILFLSLLGSKLIFAVEPLPQLPGPVEPGVIAKQLSQPALMETTTKPSISRPQEQAPSALGPAAAKIKFKLTRIILEGNHVYSTQQLEPLYKNQLNKVISVLDLEQIVESISSYYRNNGYILTRAILPPQHVKNGVVIVRVLEGYVANVKVAGNPKGSKCILEKYGRRIAACRPLKLKVMEYYLRLANEVPGVTVKAVLEPAKKEVAASDLNLVAELKSIQGYASYDNYGTRYIGPNQVTGNIVANSLMISGDSTQLTAVRTTRGLQLHYADLSYDFPIFDQGMGMTIGANNSYTQPGLNLQLLENQGDATNFYGLFRYPVLRERDQDMTLYLGANYIDSRTDIFDQTLYADHLRTMKAGASYNFSDKYKGTNTSSIYLEHGFENILGASSNPNSLFVSRFGADGKFTKLSGNFGRLQVLFWKLSAFLYASGQYSFNPLLATEQFTFGGPQIGRGYDPAELIGDKGASGTAELRADFAPGWQFLQTLEPYIFYDAGVIYNIKDLPNVNSKESATSAGGGIRFTITKNFYGNLMLAQPITRQCVSMEIATGNGRQLRGFFSLTATL